MLFFNLKEYAGFFEGGGIKYNPNDFLANRGAWFWLTYKLIHTVNGIYCQGGYFRAVRGI